MPDLLSVITRQWKQVLMITFLATALALVACLLSPKQYIGVVTALPANSELGDRGRIFNPNIEGLYAEVGASEELDRFEGTAKLDTIFLAVAKNFALINHYSLEGNNPLNLVAAAKKLRKNSTISRSGYGELKIEVWDTESEMAAALSNALFQQLNAIHMEVATANKKKVLQQLKENYQRIKAVTATSRLKDSLQDNEREIPIENSAEQLAQNARLINEYELSLQSAPNPLLVVEPARPSPIPDKPNTVQIVLLAFLASLLASFLLAVLVESRRQKV